MNCAHHWVIETPSDGDHVKPGRCKQCGAEKMHVIAHEGSKLYKALDEKARTSAQRAARNRHDRAHQSA